jgi:hydrogenase 3 maturation protease
MEWREELNKHLAGVKSLTILGIGNELMGDDAAGVLVVRKLNSELGVQNSGFDLSIYEAGTTPDNFNGLIRKTHPDLVLMIDSADMQKEPGTVEFLDTRTMHTMMHSTHTMPLSFLAGYLEKECGTKVIALGIQAGQINLEQPLTPGVARAVDQVAATLIKLLDAKE